jgi:hypothetical protein
MVPGKRILKLFTHNEIGGCVPGPGQAERNEVGKLEKDRGVGFGEAPLNARPPTSIQQPPGTAGVKHQAPFNLFQDGVDTPG